MNRLCEAEKPGRAGGTSGPYSPQSKGAAVSRTAPFQQAAGPDGTTGRQNCKAT